MIMRVAPQEIIYSRTIQKLCCRPYPNHPNGCLNYGRKPGCPPGQPLINQILDFRRPIYVIWVDFNLEQWIEQMARCHPGLKTRAQRANLRYWQPRARSELKKETEKAKQEGLIEIAVDPEAHGVNVSKLMLLVGVKIEWPVKKIVRKVVLGGFSIK